MSQHPRLYRTALDRPIPGIRPAYTVTRRAAQRELARQRDAARPLTRGPFDVHIARIAVPRNPSVIDLAAALSGHPVPLLEGAEWAGVFQATFRGRA